MSQASGPATFRPLRPASRRSRLLVFLAGPILWAVALVVLSFVLDRGDAVEFAVAVFVVSFLAGIALLGFARVMRGREEARG